MSDITTKSGTVQTIKTLMYTLMQTLQTLRSGLYFRMVPMHQETQDLVSIIIPVYNAETFLPSCLESVLNQSHHQLEVILIDDGSTDDSPMLCDSFARRDSRVKVIHQANGGIARAQNAGLDAATGEYIAFADNDDILDRHNIEFLLHALAATNADMSKARWRQFGTSDLQRVRADARRGATAPATITVFSDPLGAYQNVFCKTLRILDDLIGRHGEARYLNEANWCRLYRRYLWKGIRFPEGRYAQDTAVAGKLYTKMTRVADIDVNLYNWLQHSNSVTHRRQNANFYHDHIEAALENMALCQRQEVTPARSYYTLVGNLHYESRAASQDVGQTRLDWSRARQSLQGLTPAQHIRCVTLMAIRLIEKTIYDRRIKNMK